MEANSGHLGASWQGTSTRFGLRSAGARRVTLCLFDGPERSVAKRIPMRRHGVQQDVWSVDVPGVGPGQLYGFRVDGPWLPREGHLFNPTKLLLDPMARAIAGELRPHPATLTYPPTSGRPEVRYNDWDSAGFVPKCVVVDESFDWSGDEPLRIPWRDTVIYECHVRGMTRLHPEVEERLRGTYLGLAAPPVVEHLRSLGVTAVELLPVHQFADEARLTDHGLRNYWGYNTLGFFAPHAGYATGDRGEQVVEMKTMVRELHRAGFEVILDVVYNHTAEADHLGPTFSFKGVDNRVYYRLRAKNKTRYVNHTGCGNTLNFEEEVVRELVLESLRYWVREMHVDGFRFDLAPVLGRDHGDQFSAKARFFQELAEDSDLSKVKLIAEPWDVGPGGYRLGQFPAEWAEWNDRYRDGVRSFWRGDPGSLAELGMRLAGSRDLFGGKGPLHSISFVSCHDGFTLRDVTSYEKKHNEANAERNGDGHNHNLSRNWGHEGPTVDPEIGAARERARRNLAATLVLSQGVPMLGHGDEIGRTQKGNNNAYCQDNEVSWIDWDVGEKDRRFLGFVRRVLEVRRRYPELRREWFPTPENLLWRHPDGREMQVDDWTASRAVVAVCRGEERDLLLLLNGGAKAVQFRIPEEGRWRSLSWTELLDTGRDEAAKEKTARIPESVTLEGFSLRLYVVAIHHDVA